MDLVLDTGPLMLLVAGNVDSRIIISHKRLNDFEISDYTILRGLIAPFGNLLLTPNVMTEAASLLAQTSEPDRGKLRKALAATANDLPESYVPSKRATTQREYRWLGSTDSALLTLLSDNVALLTSDAGLHVAAIRRGHRSTNLFQHKDAALRMSDFEP